MKLVHLVVTTPDLKRVVAVRSATGWRLPRVEAADSISRVSLAGRLRATIAQVTSADVVHVAPLPSQITYTNAQYCAAVAHGATLTGGDSSEHAFLDQEQLLSDGLPLAEHVAVRTVLSRLERPVALFDSHDELAETLAWGERAFTDAIGTQPETATWHRGGRHELVVRLAAGTDAAYLRAGVDRVPYESLLTQYLWELRPNHFPETIAVDAESHRWLSRESRGTPMSKASLTTDTIVSIVRALASLQTDTIAVPGIANHLAQRRRTAVELLDDVNALVEYTCRSLPPSTADAPLVDLWGTLQSAMARKCAASDALDVPPALVLPDLAGTNVIVAPGSVAFIDIVESYWACPTLSLWRFVRDLQQRHGSNGRLLESALHRVIVDAFLAEWARLVSPRVMMQAMVHLWFLGRLLEILMFSNWLDRYEQEIGETLPAPYRAAQLAVRIRELLRSFGERAIMSQASEPQTVSELVFR